MAYGSYFMDTPLAMYLSNYSTFFQSLSTLLNFLYDYIIALVEFIYLIVNNKGATSIIVTFNAKSIRHLVKKNKHL